MKEFLNKILNFIDIYRFSLIKINTTSNKYTNLTKNCELIILV